MKIGATDEFESLYMEKFRQFAAPYGLFVEYARDRAGRDIGLHLTQSNTLSKGNIVTPALIWFQMKGIMKDTLKLDAYEASDEVAATIEVAHLKFWYMNIQPTYLTVYVESADQFLAIDIKEWINKHYGSDILKLDQKTVTVKVHKRNLLDEDFFRIALSRNLVPSLRDAFSQDDDDQIARFFRDSSLVKWLAICAQSNIQARIRVTSWISKARTEVYFEELNSEGEWQIMRSHWQFMMRELVDAFPFLTLKPKRKAVEIITVNKIDTFDGGEHEEIIRSISFVENDEEDELDWDDDEFDGECLLSIGNGEFSYGDMAGYEYVTHEIFIGLNQIGERWAETLQVLEDAEIISVDMKPHYISVAPWHARDI